MTIAWITDFPLEWLADVPDQLKSLTRGHPLTWQRVLLKEFEQHPEIQLHILVLRKGIQNDIHFERNGVQFHVLRVPPRVRATTFFWWDTLCTKRVLRKIRPDLVHAWGTEKGAGLVAGRLRIPSVLTVQGLLAWLNEQLPLNRYHKFAASLERMSFRRVSLVTTEPSFAIEYLHKKFPGTCVFQAEHAPDLVFHQLQRKPDSGSIRFLFCGLISKAKGLDLLFAALSRLPTSLGWECVLVGSLDPAFKQEWNDLQQQPVWEKIIWRQNLSPQEIASELTKATIFLFPTRGDTSPNAVKEAVVAGVPVVASRVGGIPDYLVQGKNGFLFEPGDLDSFVAAIAEALKHPRFSKGLVDPEMLSKVRHYLSPQKMADRFIEAYQIALGQRKMPENPRLAPL